METGRSNAAGKDMSKYLAKLLAFSGIGVIVIAGFAVGANLPIQLFLPVVAGLAVFGFIGVLPMRLGIGAAAGASLGLVGAVWTGFCTVGLVYFGQSFLVPVAAGLGLSVLGIAGLSMAVNEAIDNDFAGAAR